jgi:hypothetical protein
VLGPHRRDETGRSPPDLAVLGEEGRRFSEDLAFLGEDAVLAAQPAQLLALVAGQSLSLALIDVELTGLVAQRLRRTSKLLGELRDRAAARPEQPNRLQAELQRIRRGRWHRQTSSPAGQSAQPSDVHETVKIPVGVRAGSDLP